MTNLKIIYQETPRKDYLQFLAEGLESNSQQNGQFNSLDFFGFFLTDEQEKIYGGISGFTYYGCLYIDQLFISPEFQQQGYGRQLVAKTEKIASTRHCAMLTVNTMNWEGRNFYEKLGFYVEFARKGYENNGVLYFLRKDMKVMEEDTNVRVAQAGL